MENPSYCNQVSLVIYSVPIHYESGLRNLQEMDTIEWTQKLMKRMSDQRDEYVKSKPKVEKISKDANSEDEIVKDAFRTTKEENTENVKESSSNGIPILENDEKASVNALQSTSVSSEEEITNTSAGSSRDERISFTLVFGKEKYSVTRSLDESVDELRKQVEELTGVPPNMQKLMSKGMLKDGQTLRDAKLTNGCKIMLIGSTPTQVAAANTAPKAEELRQAEAQASSKEPLCKQKQHAKILEKGIPDDVMPGIKNARDALPSQPLYGMINKMANKVRLTFKLEMDQVWLGTKERTDKIPMSQIKDIVSEPIEGHEEYHIVGLQLGPTEASRYWLYWVPAQYVAAIKEAILG